MRSCSGLLFFFSLLLLLLFLTSCTWEEFASGGATGERYNASELVGLPQPQVGQEPLTCADSDNGQMFTLKGEVSGREASGRVFTYTDTCISSSKLQEYFCQPGSAFSFTEVPCEHGCEDGACLVQAAAPMPEVPAQQEPITIMVNGQYPPPTLQRGEEFTVSWDAPGLRDCAGTGHHILTPEGELWSTQMNLPSTGSMQLLAKHKNLPTVGVLQLKVNCFTQAGTSVTSGVEIPLVD